MRRRRPDSVGSEYSEDSVDSSGSGRSDSPCVALNMFQGLNQTAAAYEMMEVSPDIHGYLCLKREVMMGLLPCCAPRWERRLFLAKGGYLFRYVSELSKEPKGSPIPLIEARIDVVPALHDPDEVSFTVVTHRKILTLRADSKESRNKWVRALLAARYKEIKASKGHAVVSRVDAVAHNIGKAIHASKESYHKHRHEAEAQELSRAMPGAMY